ncbi:alkaline phosphatase family protein [Pelagibius sp.]|uniref:alkaline phosphatase family protein n=1 Tax=Pelagibius sp. TaxID=1931238 RepID=UPI003B512F1F
MPSDPQVILVVLDGLRRDFVTAAYTPNLHAFLRENVDYRESRAVFPSMTRVNAAAIGSGCVPGTTGVIANQFYDPKVFADGLFHTGKVSHIEAAMQAYEGRFVTVDGLAESLVAGGRSLAVVTSASGGTTRVLNPRVAENGQVSLCLRDWGSSYPKAFADRVMDGLGGLPDLQMPAVAISRCLTDIVLDHVMPEVDPDVAIVWYGDPDYTFHYRGLGSEEALAAMRAVDQQFARLVDWARDPARRRDIQILVASDHGHINAVGRVEAGRELREAGFDLDPASGPQRGLLGAPLQVGAVRALQAADNTQLLDLVQFLREQPWCGAIFTQGPDGSQVPNGLVAGTLNSSLLLNDHARSPDLFYTLAVGDEAGPRGVPGSGRFVGSELKEGGSTHGGLSSYEMRSVLGAGGSAFRNGVVSALPCGVVDIAPTVLSLLGIAPPPLMSGRVLSEGLAGHDTAALTEPEDEVFETVHAFGRDVLRRRRLGQHVYVQEADVQRIEGGAALRAS